MRKLKILERAAWIVGLVLIGIWAGFRVHSQLGRESALERFEQAKSEPPGPPVDPVESPVRHGRQLMADAPVDFTLWDEGRVEAYQRSLEIEMDRPLAILRIPKIALEVPVFHGTDELVLNRAVGRIVGTAKVGEPGNLGLAGHRDGFFRGLKDVEVEDTIELETLTRTDIYEVDAISIVNPDDVHVLEPTAETQLTLVTCYPFYYVGKAPQRYIVHSRLVESLPAARTRGTQRTDATRAESTSGSDSPGRFR